MDRRGGALVADRCPRGGIGALVAESAHSYRSPRGGIGALVAESAHSYRYRSDALASGPFIPISSSQGDGAQSLSSGVA